MIINEKYRKSMFHKNPFGLADKLPDGFPQITQPPSTKVVEIGHTAVLYCAAAGSPSPKISWVRDSLPVDTAGNPRYSILDKPKPGMLNVITILFPFLKKNFRFRGFANHRQHRRRSGKIRMRSRKCYRHGILPFYHVVRQR